MSPINRFMLLGLLLLSPLGNLAAKTTVYGTGSIHHISANAKTPFYLQVGAYRSLHGARRIKAQYLSYGLPIHIARHGEFHAVLIGPIPTYTELKQFSNKPMAHTYQASPKTSVTQKYRKQIAYEQPQARKTQASNTNWFWLGKRETHPKRSTYSKEPRYLIPPDGKDGNTWYAQLEGGAAFPTYSSSVAVPNGSNFTPPSHLDSYATSRGTQGLIAFYAGRRWDMPLQYFSHASLGLRYQYLFQRDIGETISQYSHPDFTNYNYSWKVSANTLTADTKLNFAERYRFSPYITGGIGISFNEAQSYSETALPPVTARFTPGFQNHTQTEFAYHAGAGLDYQLKDQWLVSLGYLYEQLGVFSSGNGVGSWSQDYLSLGQYRANEIRLGLTYVTD